MNKNIPTIIGWFGTVILLVGFVMISFGLLPAQSYSYLIMNVIGSIFIIVDTVSKKDYPPTALNVVWAMIALIAIVNLSIK